ncbi:MAG: hypothetical protein OIF32_12665 [Campylobacterales bacterium]|nr:hypothetical protein [Campylobacterales bacterium]
MKGILLSVIMALSFILVGCSDKDSTEAKEYEVKQALDKGNYHLVIREYGDCQNSSKTTSEKADCLAKLTNQQKMDLGAAYMGKAGYTLVDLGSDILGIEGTKEEKSKEVLKIIMRKLDDDGMDQGIQVFKSILTNNDTSVCTKTGYANLSQEQKQACVSVNPILLKELVEDDDGSGSTSSTAVSLEDVIKFKDVLKDAAPGIEIDDIVSIINDDVKSGAPSEKDVNGDGNLDTLEATQCVVKDYDTTGTLTCEGVTTASTTVTRKSVEGTSIFGSTSGFENVFLVKVIVPGGSFDDFTSYRLVQKISGVDANTSLALEENKYCGADTNVVSSCSQVNPSTPCLPCPVKKSDGSGTTLVDTASSVLTGDLLTSIAVSSDSEGDLSDSEKTSKLQTEMCGLTPGADSNKTSWISDSSCQAAPATDFKTSLEDTIENLANTNCDCKDGKIVVGQSGILNFMSGN